MFIGTYRQNIDAKGRLSIPARFRETLNTSYNGKLILTNFENYIISYPTEEWMKFQEKLTALPTNQKETRDFMRIIFGGACECSLDNQGRILIPPVLREHAGIQKGVAMIGIMNKIEIWGHERFDQFKEEKKEMVNNLPDKLGEIGFL